MKILMVLIVLSQLSKIQGTNNTENTTVFVSKGGNITLSCADSNASFVIWRRTNEVISEGFNINPHIAGSNKFAMTKEYRLNIFSITDDELGPYWCEIQVNNEAIEKRIHVKFTEHRSTELNTGRTSEQTTEMRKMQYGNIVTTQSYSTGHHRRHYTIQSTGSSCHGTFYIQDFTAVAVLVLLFFSVIANVFLVCLMLKGFRCVQLIDKTHILRNRGAHNEIAIPEVFSREMEVLRHHYETINDDEILPPTLVSTTQTVSAIESTPGGDGDQGQTRSFTLPQDVITVEPSRYSITFSSVSTDSNVSLEKPIEVLYENAYLNPYVALRINEMEYLSSYSALTNAGSPFRHVP